MENSLKKSLGYPQKSHFKQRKKPTFVGLIIIEIAKILISVIGSPKKVIYGYVKIFGECFQVVKGG